MEQSAVAYFTNGKIIVAPVRRTTAGLGLEMNPATCPPVIDDIVPALRNALMHSEAVASHPAQSEWSGFFKPFQEAAGVGSYAAFMKNARRVDVRIAGGQIELTPQRNLGAKEGFEPIPEGALTFPVEDEHKAAFALLSMLD